MPPLSIPFHAFTIKHNGRADRIITPVQIFPPFKPESPPDPLPVPILTNALWDTGASRSVLTASVVSKLKIPAVGTVEVHHAGGKSFCQTYIINVGLPNGVGIPGVLVSVCPDTLHFGAIIGMDIICQGDFALTNAKGETWLSYRYPSVKAIDYVVESDQIAFGGIGRNKPCPCGATMPNGRRKKYKECHGKGF